MAYGLIVPRKIAAQNIDSLNRSAVSASAYENGFVGYFSGKSSTAGEEEVWTMVAPATAHLYDLWMCYEPELVITDSKYKNINPDPRDFIVAIGDVFSVFKPQVGDLISMSSDALAGTQSTNTYVVATDGAQALTWASAAVSGLSLKLVDDDDYISLGIGSIGTQRIAMDLFEVERVSGALD